MNKKKFFCSSVGPELNFDILFSDEMSYSKMEII